MFCMKCGQQLPDDANFCFHCGAPVGNKPAAGQQPPALPTQNAPQPSAPATYGYGMPQTPQQEGARQEQYVGAVLKCPNCGATVSNMDMVCPSCGYQITGRAATNSVKQFADSLMRLEAQRSNGLGAQIASSIASSIGLTGISGIDRQIISLIGSFPIPNNIEDISEFVYLALGNIDTALSKNTLMNNIPNGSMQMNGRKKISDAWVAKLQQAYAKARSMFPNEPAFKQLDMDYRAIE